MKPNGCCGRALLAVFLLHLSGCCTMARLFCGPDQSPWVQVSHATPAATLATFLEGIRRDDRDRVYDCLAQSYLRTHGLDRLVANAAWQRLHDEVPGLHLLGYATVPAAPLRQQDGGCTYAIEVEGKVLTIDLVRQSYWEVRYRAADGTEKHPGATLDFDSLNGLVAVAKAADDPDGMPQASVAVAPLRFVLPGQDELRLAEVDAVAVGREWKIANIALPQ